MKKQKLFILLFCLAVVSTNSFSEIIDYHQGLLPDHIFINGISGIVTGENELPIYENPALLGSALEGSLKYTISIAGNNRTVNSVVYRPQLKTGTFSLLFDTYKRMIEKSRYDERQGIYIGDKEISNQMVALGWGHSLPVSAGSHSIGVNINYGFSTQSDEFRSNALTLDFGYLFQFTSNLRLGLTVKSLVFLDLNQRKSINNYITRDFQIGCGLGYTRTFRFKSNMKWLKMSPEFCLKYTVIKNENNFFSFDGLNSMDLLFLNTAGVKLTFGTQNGELIYGPEFKLSFLDHFSIRVFSYDFYYPEMIYRPTDKQWVIGITVFNILEWKMSNLRWWEIINN